VTEPTGPPARTPWGAAFSWCFHDLANTIFSAVVVTIFLPLYATAQTGRAWPVGAIATLSMFAAAFVVPVLGSMVDRTGRAKAYLVRTYLAYSLLAVGMSLAALHPSGVWGVLALFAAANFAYQASLVFYNSLLPVVAAPGRQGLVSGLGVGLGYLGQPLSLGLAFLVVQRFGIGWTFALAGALVVLFSVPLQIWVPERAVGSPEPVSRRLLRGEYRTVLRNLRSLPRRPDLAWFLAGNFLCVDALNTAIFWTGVYLVNGVGMEKGQMLLTIVVANLSAFALGCLQGWLTDRIGAKRAMLLAAFCLLTAILWIGTARSAVSVQAALWTVGAAGLGGLWVAGRKLLLDLVPAEKAGEYFGLYGMSNKGAAFGVAMFAVLSDLFSYRAALLATAIPLVLGILALSRVRLPRAPEAHGGDAP